jgi:hypothetical protein
MAHGTSCARLTTRAPSARADRTPKKRQHDCPDRRVEGQTHNAANKVKIEARQKPIASHDADACLADNPKAGAAHDLTRQISGSRADQQDHDYAFVAIMQAIPSERRIRRLF